MSHPMFALIPPLSSPLMGRERERERKTSAHHHPILNHLTEGEICEGLRLSYPLESFLSSFYSWGHRACFRGSWGMCRYGTGVDSYLPTERGERERETSDSPYIKSSTHRQTMLEVLGESSYVFSQPSKRTSETERERERERETSDSP